MQNNWQPQWTTQVKIESGGRFPLGLNRFHDGLEEILIKSIVVAANRLRYITYCCWAIGDIENRESCEEYNDFIEAFRRRENALGLGLFQMAPEYSIPGSTALSKIVRDGVKEYDCSFDLMESNVLGAFGLYYKGTIYNLGLTESDEEGIIVLTDLGRELYDIAERYYEKKNPEYWRKYAGKRKVPSAILCEWGEINDFDNICKAECKEERAFYKRLIFRLSKKQVGDYRRDTFTFFLECIDRCASTNTIFNEDVLRNIHYYSCYYDNNDKIRKYTVPRRYDDVYFYWYIYEGHVYFRWWLEFYFDAFLRYLKSCDNGASIDDFFAQIDIDEFNSTMRHFSKQRKDFYSASMRSIFALFPEASELSDSLSEEAIHFDEDDDSTSSILAKFVLMTANLYRRYIGVRADKRYQYVAANLGTDLWFDVLFRLNNIEKISVLDFLKIILKKHIIEQHDLIMMEKRDLRRCWFTIENRQFIFQADASPMWRTAKYDTIMHYLKDMNLIKESNNIVKLTQDGKDFHSNLIKEYY